MVVEYKDLDRKGRKDFQKVYKKMYSLINFSFEDLSDAIEEDVNDTFKILLYVIKEKIVGCVYVHEYDYYADTYFPDGCYYLSNLYVDKKYRRLGIATKMLAKVEEIARENNVSVIISDYIDDNKNSASWHKKCGFEVFKKEIVVIKKI